MGWTGVSFYTSGTGYEQEAAKLLGSAAKHNVPMTIYPYPSRGSWRANLNYKSALIRRALDENEGTDVVFIDADARIRSYPILFDELSAAKEFDIAAHFFMQSRLERGELLSGTLWIANNEAARRLVDSWHQLALSSPHIRHQKCLHLAMQKNEQGYRVCHLPIEYTCIFDTPARRGKVAVIEHYQASRRLRRAVRAAA